MKAATALASLLALTLTLGGCQKATGDDEAFGRRVRAYLLAHPEVLQEVSEKLQAKMADAETVQRRQAQGKLASLRAAIEHDPRDLVVNPQGRITVTEFYDYRCPHCVNAAPKLLALMQAHPEVRVVFKEMPIFGAVSEHASRAAMAVRTAGGDGLGVYKAFMDAHGLDDAAIDRIALAKGARAADLAPNSALAKKAAEQLAATTKIFNALDLGGTPAFIVGDQIILGEDMDAVNAAVARAASAKAG